ncbi:CBN-SEA-1 protein [Caenorhabditis brenneri]|uniref:CBN-SEA-1 protein n=1 Tax=Caenorhabditis brenneri TaxID=135651 RepID=G0N6W7_CAEBE|nr:CBN-SEA-1 protein [Caenorhabditis brenneri]
MENYQQFYGTPPMLNGTVVPKYQSQADQCPQPSTIQYEQCNGAAQYAGYPYYGNGDNYTTPPHDPSTTNYYGHAYMDAMATVPPFYGTHAPYANGDNYRATFAPLPANPYRIANGVQYWQHPGESQQSSTSAANTPLQSAVIQNAPLQPHQKIFVTLRNEKEWIKYSKETNEMFITNNGKPLFPILMYDVQGLEAQSTYCTSIHLKKMSVGQMKYSEVKKQWEENKNSDERAENLTEIFSETMSGAAWGLKGISSSRRIKIYNIGNDRRKAAARKQLTDEEKLKQADEKSRTMLQVNTHVRYLPVLRIYKLDSMDNRHLVEEKSFPETEFVTVTEYKNQWIALNKTADNPSTKSEYREEALAQIEKENNSPGSSTSSGSSSGYGSSSGMASGSSDTFLSEAPTSRKTRKAPAVKNPRAAKAMKSSESNTSSGASDPSVGYYGADNSPWSGFNGYMY